MLKRKNIPFLILFLSVIFTFYSYNKSENPSININPNEKSLKEALKGKFHIGTTLNAWQIMGRRPEEMEIVKKHFNSIVSENIMKSERIQPEQGEFDFSLADKFVEFGEANNMHIHGHTLIWHSQTPDWFFVDQNGNPVSKEVLIERMKDHIQAVVGRYKGRIHSWDVVNEAIEDDGSYRDSKFYKIIGEDFIKLAFEFAHKADPDARLYYNDYSMSNPRKRNGVVNMVKNLHKEGVPIHGIGMQGHIGLGNPDIHEFENSLEAYGKLGEVMITELDLSVLPSPWGDAGAEISDNYQYEDKMNPFPDALPEEVQQQFTKRYLAFFELFLKHQDNISRVALWGINDGNSWKNNWPVRGRTDYPLLFDRNNKAKPVVKEIIELASRK
ncbi:endo-1,4-beta-xylanase [Salegentibacter sp. 24]|uniref:endo-1,4-beta-xylanase n=1 Tax=Salegentibacter sp. 24 TaxID=2183986 RepID=UPI0010601E2D|nr:endo-1,4-beta-xylanase [Salegentibacter sp. 24]TDN90384.1 endo-1,4-beta-xylanase [Salegentibacter sp. 24]